MSIAANETRNGFLLACLLLSGTVLPAAHAAEGSYPRIEAAFDLNNLTTNPFDYQTTDVEVTIQGPHRLRATIPAFYDGGTHWRVRYTPMSQGTFKIASITLNGQPSGAANIAPQEWKVSGNPGPGFIRIDKKNPLKFAFDNGQRYFPLGENCAWGDTAVIFPKMAAAHENWSRVWMTHWAGNNLDWVENTPIPAGQLSLTVAKHWDDIVDTAEKTGVYIHVTLQHHGQYSSTTNSNWGENPWNAKNGGFLTTPEEFFTSERAKQLTKLKYRYIIARWGYSPAIMGWELFNEVQWTDAINNKKADTVAAWHKEMADFLHAQDPFHHLVTTSSDQNIVGLFDNVDYLQHHDYANDLIGTARNATSAISPLVKVKPDFGGETGSGDSGAYSLRAVLFASIMANESGAAQPWYWDQYERDNLYAAFAPAALFVQASKLPDHDQLTKTELTVESSSRVPLILRPGGGWDRAEEHDFTIDGNNPPTKFYKFPPYFFGTNNSNMNPGPLVFHVNYAKPETVTMHVGEVGKSGAHLKFSVDGQMKLEQDYPATEHETRVHAAFPVDIPAGPHTLTIDNSGLDWVNISDITFPDATRPICAYGLTDGHWAAIWMYHRAQVFDPNATASVTGKLNLTGLQPGKYRAIWWDTVAGAPINTVAVDIADTTTPILLDTPPIVRDVALYVEKR